MSTENFMTVMSGHFLLCLAHARVHVTRVQYTPRNSCDQILYIIQILTVITTSLTITSIMKFIAPAHIRGLDHAITSSRLLCESDNFHHFQHLPLADPSTNAYRTISLSEGEKRLRLALGTCY